MAEANGDKPEFDVSELSWDDVQKLAMLQPQINSAVEANDAPAMGKAFADLREIFTTVTVSIPRTWLVKRAPGDLDWTKPESFGYLHANKIADLTAALNAQLAGDSDPKNVSAS